MSIELLRAKPEHIPELARIVFTAFKKISDDHGFPLDIPSLEVATMLTTMIVTRPDFYGVTAFDSGKIIGSNFAQLSDPVAGIGPITVDPDCQSKGAGRLLMKYIVDHCLAHHGPMVRLLQDTFNMTSLSLYTSLGYQLQEPIVLTRIPPAEKPDPTVRPLVMTDLDATEKLCVSIYKVSRRNELAAMIQHGSAAGVIPHGRFINSQLTAYLIPGFFGYAVAKTPTDLLDLAEQTARTSPPPLQVILLPARTETFRQAIERKYRSIKMLSLMSIGPYESPTNAWAPSIAY